MAAFARQFLAWILLSLAFVLDNFWSIVGVIAITVGVTLIYLPAGWIVGGLLLLAAAEFYVGTPKGRSK